MFLAELIKIHPNQLQSSSMYKNIVFHFGPNMLTDASESCLSLPDLGRGGVGARRVTDLTNRFSSITFE